MLKLKMPSFEGFLSAHQQRHNSDDTSSLLPEHILYEYYNN
jgi:hypothetical protein